MKLSLRSFIPTLTLCLFLPFIVADDNDDMRLVGVRTFLLAPASTPTSVLTAIDAGMDLISDDDDRRGRMTQEEEEDVGYLRATVEHERKLRCSACVNYPASYRGCWVNWVWTPRCRQTPRSLLIVHQMRTNEDIENLNDNERRRYLQLAQLCQDAIDDRDDEIIASTTAGIVPLLPTNASFVEECIFEEIDDEDDDE